MNAKNGSATSKSGKTTLWLIMQKLRRYGDKGTLRTTPFLNKFFFLDKEKNKFQNATAVLPMLAESYSSRKEK
jgi:hypothetical protein